MWCEKDHDYGDGYTACDLIDSFHTRLPFVHQWVPSSRVLARRPAQGERVADIG
jgi:hypothetical protein